MIFISSPYSNTDDKIVNERFDLTCELVALLLRKGNFVLSPIVHGHNLLKYDLPGDWEFWENYCVDMIKSCDEVWVYDLPGWDESNGVKGEIKVGKQLNKSVFLINNKGEKIRKL